MCIHNCKYKKVGTRSGYESCSHKENSSQSCDISNCPEIKPLLNKAGGFRE